MAPSPTPTPVRRFVQTHLHTPRSHDFNADVNCGGEPELFAGLVRLTPDYEVRPDWAERWQTSNESTRWLFSLRRVQAGWSNGDPVSAQDFVWSWQRLLSLDPPPPQAPLLEIIGNAKQIRQGTLPPEQLAVRALDPWTLEIELERPAGYFPLILGTAGLFPAHRPSVERWGQDWTQAGGCVSNGPLQLVSWDADGHLVLTANPHYWNRPALLLDRVEWLVPPLETPLLGFFQGQVDLAMIPVEQLADVTSDELLLPLLERSILPEVWLLLIQPDQPPFDRPELRRALSLAIDRERLRDLVYGAVEPAYSLIPTGVAGHLEAKESELGGFNPLEAFQLWQPVREQGVPPLRLTAPLSRPRTEETIIHDVVTQLSQNLGVAVELERHDEATWEQTLRSGNFQLLWWRWPLPFPDGAAVYEWLFSRERKTLQGLRWEQAEFEHFLTIARKETELSRRLGGYRQCELLLQRASIALPLAYPVSTVLVQPWVTALPRNRSGMLVLSGTLFSRFHSGIVIQPRAGSK